MQSLRTPDSPATLFQTLTRRKLPDVMTHQRDTLRAYSDQMLGESDGALQLPTGSGKLWSVYLSPNGADGSSGSACCTSARRGSWSIKPWSRPTWVGKLPSTVLQELSPRLTVVLDANSNAGKDVTFRWLLLRDHLEACHVYVASREILFRPLIPPVWSHPPFAGAPGSGKLRTSAGRRRHHLPQAAWIASSMRGGERQEQLWRLHGLPNLHRHGQRGADWRLRPSRSFNKLWKGFCVDTDADDGARHEGRRRHGATTTS